MDQTKHPPTKRNVSTRRSFLRSIAAGAAVAATLPVVGLADKFLLSKYGPPMPGKFLPAHGVVVVRTGIQYAMKSPWNDSLYGADEAVYVAAQIASESNV